MKKDDGLTASMEDYIEMIYRLSIDKGFTRINYLSNSLNVQPPSATKMVQKLSELKLADYEKYGFIILTAEGKKIGEVLLKRHMMVEEFLRLLGVSDSVLEEAEKIEHILDEEALKCISFFVAFIKDNPEIEEQYKSYRNVK
jgi:Mn-dependent DtxR family transcriptional regulator